MTACLLCHAPAVADGLCVADGARLWASESVLKTPALAREMYGARVVSNGPRAAEWQARFDALGDISSPLEATKFLARLNTAREERQRQTCGRDGCKPCEEGRS